MQPMPPCWAPACWWQKRVSGLLLCWELQLGMQSVGFIYLFFSSWLCCSLRFQNSPQTRRGFPGVWKLLFKIPFPGQISIPNRFVFLFICYILFYLLLKTNGCLSGCLVSSASVQKLFCGICSAFKWSFEEFVGEEVVSPSYSFAILGPLHSLMNYKAIMYAKATHCFLGRN